MIIFNEYNEPIIIDSLTTPLKSEKMWVLNLDLPQPNSCKSTDNLIDFTLAPILAFEETTSPSLVLSVEGFEFPLPASWYVLVYDYETAQLDTVQVADLGGREFTSFAYGPNMTSQRGSVIRVTDFRSMDKNISPLLNKHLMLCHAIGPDVWITISPSDPYNKYLKDKVIGDII